MFKANNCILISSEISAIIGSRPQLPPSVRSLSVCLSVCSESESDAADFINHIIISFHCMSCKFPIEIVVVVVVVVIVVVVVVVLLFSLLLSCRVLCLSL